MRSRARVPRPPRTAQRILRLALHPDDREAALSDLEEEFDARRERDGDPAAIVWYRSQARRSVWPALRRRLMKRLGPSLLTELRWAWRGVRARRLGSMVHVALIAITVGAGAVVFSAADAFVFRPAPYPNAGRLVIFQRPSPVGLVDYLRFEEYVALRARTDLFRGMYGHLMGGAISITAGGITESVRMQDVEAGLFEALGVVPRWGRPLQPSDESAGGESAVVIREDLARRLFGDPAVAIGRAIEAPDGSLRVVGVMAARFRFPTAVEKIWRARAGARPGERRSTSVVAAVAPGVEMHVVEQAVAGAFTRAAPGNTAIGSMTAVPLSKALKDPRAFTNAGAFTSVDAPQLFTLLLGAAVCLALIVSFNIAGLELASTLERTRIYAVQTALGATRATLIFTAMLEGVLLTLAGSLAGVGLAVWGTSVLAAALPAALDNILANPIDLDLRAAVFLIAVAVTAAALTRLPVIWHIGRHAFGYSLRRNAPRMTASRTQSAFRYLLMTGQVALSVILLVAAVLFVRTYAARAGEDKGFDSMNLATMEVAPPRGSSASSADLGQAIIARLRSHPAVRSISRTERLPPGFRGGAAQHLWIAGATSPAAQVTIASFGAEPDYFQTMGIRLVNGRFPVAADSPDHVVVDEAFARRFWPDGGAVGARYSLGTPQAPGRQTYEIVGVTSRVRLDAARAPMGGELFVVHRTMPADAAPLAFAIRLSAEEPLGDLASLVRSMAPGSVVRTGWMDERYAQTHGAARIAAGMTSGFGFMACGVAMVGLYGVTAFLVSGRTREIGIRIALGADGRDIRRLAIRPAMRCIALGLSAGTSGALLASRWIGSQLSGIQPTDPATYGGVAVTVAITAFIATWRPARRAAAVDPAITLRAE